MNERIKVVLLEPDKEAKIAEIETTLESMQHLVGDGFIEAFYPFEEEVCIVCNDEGKINGLPQLARYQKQFRLPEYFFRSSLGIAAVPYVPSV